MSVGAIVSVTSEGMGEVTTGERETLRERIRMGFDGQLSLDDQIESMSLAISMLLDENESLHNRCQEVEAL